MAVFRVEKNHNYTVMSNYHLRDTALTLKAIGLLSKMLSLTDEWDYTTRGLAAICKEGVDAIGAALKELEARGYLVRRQLKQWAVKKKSGQGHKPVIRLRFSKSGDPDIERWYSTHFVDAKKIAELKAQRMTEIAPNAAESAAEN